MLSLPPGFALTIQPRTNLVAVLGERLTVLDPDTRDVIWDRAAPADAFQVQFARDAARLYVTTEHGDLVAFDGASGEELGRRSFAPGRCWVRSWFGSLTVLREAGEILAWSADEPEPVAWYQTDRPILRPLDTASVQDLHLEQSAAGPVLVSVRRGDVARTATISGYDVLHANVCGGVMALDPSHDGAPRRLRQVYPGADGALFWYDQYTLDADGPVRALVCAGDPEWLYVVRSGGVLVWRLPKRERSLLAPPFTDQNPCPPSDVMAASPLAELITPDPIAVAASMDGQWLAATGPSGGLMVPLRTLLKPRANKPDLEHLRGLPAIVAAVCRWKYPSALVNDVLRSALYDNLINLDWLAAAAPEVRAWCVTVHLEHFLDWDGLSVTVDKFPAHVLLAATCYEALGLPAVAKLYRDAEPWIPRYEADEDGAGEALDAIGDRITKASRKAPALRVAWLLTHQAAFAAL